MSRTGCKRETRLFGGTRFTCRGTKINRQKIEQQTCCGKKNWELRCRVGRGWTTILCLEWPAADARENLVLLPYASFESKFPSLKPLPWRRPRPTAWVWAWPTCQTGARSAGLMTTCSWWSGRQFPSAYPIWVARGGAMREGVPCQSTGPTVQPLSEVWARLCSRECCWSSCNKNMLSHENRFFKFIGGLSSVPILCIQWRWNLC